MYAPTPSTLCRVLWCTGTIPQDILDIFTNTTAVELYLESNMLSGSLPVTLGSSDDQSHIPAGLSLAALDLSSNSLEGEQLE